MNFQAVKIIRWVLNCICKTWILLKKDEENRKMLPPETIKIFGPAQELDGT